MQRLRGAVFVRANSHCEGCGRWINPHESAHLDHFFGRSKVPEAPSNCWGLCIACDDAKTNNRPSAAFWLKRFINHCWRHGLAAEKELAATKLAVLIQKGFAK